MDLVDSNELEKWYKQHGMARMENVPQAQKWLIEQSGNLKDQVAV